MKLVVGLGNPGRKYEGTRHNVAWEVVEELARRHAASRPRHDFEAEVLEASLHGEKVLLLRPLTYMNCSGRSVGRAAAFYKLEPADVLVICDDWNLPLGKLRIRGQGSSGGQKGLADIVRTLGTEAAPRLRIGIGRPPSGWDPADYVLSKFRADERSEIEHAVALAADAVAVWVADGLQQAMNRYNKPADGES